MRRMLVLLAAGGLLLAACGTDEPETTTGGGGDVQQDETAATVEVADSDLGEILVDADGNTLYMFVPDQEEGEPTCYDDCADAWPAFEAGDEPTAGEGIDQALLGTVERTDGSDQVIYNDLPLYYFSGDEEAGDTNGQSLNDVWWVLAPDGEPIRGDKEAKEGPGY